MIQAEIDEQSIIDCLKDENLVDKVPSFID
jgi:hypothetical protein